MGWESTSLSEEFGDCVPVDVPNVVIVDVLVPLFVVGVGRVCLGGVCPGQSSPGLVR